MMTSTGTMSNPACLTCSQLRPKVPAQRPARCAARRSADEPERRLDSMKIVLSSLAAAALLQVPSADAGVIIEKSAGRKFYQGSNTSKASPVPEQGKESKGGSSFSFPSVSLPSVSLPSLPGLPSAPQLSPPSVSLSPASGSFDPLTFVLPAAVAAIGGVGFLASKFDVGFAEFFSESIVKDSGGFAGYEESLKGQNEGFAGLSLPGGLPNPFAKEEEPQGKRGSKSVTKRGGSQPKVGGSQARSKKGGKEEGGTGLLGGLFNKK